MMWKELLTTAILTTALVNCDAEGSPGRYRRNVQPPEDSKSVFAGEKAPDNNLGGKEFIKQGSSLIMYSDKGARYSASSLSSDNAKKLGESPCTEDPDFKDYKGTKKIYTDSAEDFTPAQLNPCDLNTFSAQAVTDTLTYANTVPLPNALSAKWKTFHGKLAEGYAKICADSKGTLYLLTGVHDDWYKVTIEDEVVTAVATEARADKEEIGKEDQKLSVPGFVWAAVCCVVGKPGDEVDYQAGTTSSMAVIGQLKKGEAKPTMYKIGVTMLEGPLGDVKLFPGNEDCKNTYTETFEIE